jgi:hypothetical protein
MHGKMVLVSQRWQRNAGRAGWRFVPAPAWPPPPSGWSPPPGWQPDPAWSTPPGWRWLRRRRLPIVLIGAGVLLFGFAMPFGFAALFGVEILDEAHGHSLDPTDPMNYNRYALRNDSTTPLYVHLCADPSCVALDGHFDWDLVNPGSADDQEVYWGSSTPTAYAVARSPSDTGRRCLLLNAATKAQALVDSPLSLAGTCG